MLNLLRKSVARKQIARDLHDELVARARAPVFFAALGVPDTLDGRFDLLALHAWLLLTRLKGINDIAQDLTDTLFTGFDEALREQGAGDMSMGHKMKAIADAFFGRLAAYEAACAATANGDALAAALARNLWRGGVAGGQVRILASYVRSARQSLETSAVEEGRADFGPLPDLSEPLI